MKIISLAEMQALALGIATHYDIVKEHGDGSYTSHCPLHGGNCLRITPSDKLLAHCLANPEGDCTYDNLLARFKVDGFDAYVICTDPRLQRKGARGKDKDTGLRQNIPAHDQSPLNWKAMTLRDYQEDGTYDNVLVTHCYPYTNEKGEVIWYQLRANTNRETKKGKKVKVIRPWSSIKDTRTNTDTWDTALLIDSKRPLYNLKGIADNPGKPVLIVEGEKACEAAKILLSNYVCTTYSMGMGSWTKTDFSPLRGRDVTLWPDNSKGSIKHFLDLAATLEPIPKIVMLEPLKDRETDWDLADDYPPEGLTIELLLKQAAPAPVSPLTGEDEEEIIEKYNKHLRMLWLGGSIHVYDINAVTQDTWLPYAYYTFADLPRAFPEKMAPTGKGRKPPYSVEAWRDYEGKIKTYGITYDPETVDETVMKDGLLHTNKFLGFAHEPKACDPARWQCLIDHINLIMDPTSAKYLVNFIAHIIQHPKEKPGVLPILIGKQATGKSIIWAIIRKMLGWRNVLITDGRTFNSKWSGQFSGKLLIVVNEYTTAKQDADFMNTFITDNTISLEHKGKPISSEESYHRAIGTTNNEDFSISLDDRRFFPIKVDNPSIDSFGKPETNLIYFKPLVALLDDSPEAEEALSGLHYYFKNYKMDMNVRVVPKTEFRSSGMAPLNPVHRFILDVCENGSLPDAFGLTYVDPEIAPYSKTYPSKMLRAHVTDMLRDHYQFKGGRASDLLMPFIGPKRLSKQTVIDMPFHRHGGNKSVADPGRGRIFELPPLEELRALYTKLVDTSRIWGPILRVVRDEDDDDSPV